MNDWRSIPLTDFKAAKPHRHHSVVYILRDRLTNEFKVGHAVAPRERFMRSLITYRGRRELELAACGLVDNTVTGPRAVHPVEERMHRELQPFKTGHGRDWSGPLGWADALARLALYTTPCPPQIVLVAEATRSDPMEVLRQHTGGREEVNPWLTSTSTGRSSRRSSRPAESSS